jgi:general secretion pathway protein G
MDETNVIPADLSEIGQLLKKDPWGRPYVYQDLSIPGAKARKNKALHPLNTYFDLYSMGKDGQTVLALTAGPSRDDIIVANDGRFVGMAKDYGERLAGPGRDQQFGARITRG